MQKIYMHQGDKVFLENNLAKSVETGWNRWAHADKMGCALWASPFNVPNSYTWENFWYADYGNVGSNAIREAFEGEGFHEEFVTSEFYSIKSLEQFYQQTLTEQRNSQLKWYCERENIEISDEALISWNNDAPALIQKAKELIAEQCKEYRDNSFYFIVDQSKILHIYSMKDIGPYIIEKQEIPGMDWTRKTINYDAIREDGYSGIEVHNIHQLRWGEDGPTMFNIWDCDSIAIWDSDCIMQIEREIACLSRLSQFDNLEIVDLQDLCIDKSHLEQWAQSHQSEIMRAIQDGILPEDILVKLLDAPEKTEQEIVGIER